MVYIEKKHYIQGQEIDVTISGWDDPESEESLKGLFKFMGQNTLRYAQL